ncbi:TPA: hypothetical protein I8Y21_005002 [Klebsiella oxytoca]|uniref:Uncharacterized protein n=1 Tax=Klebsiella oxytoca TaxID=571 RepID=A0AAN5RFW7_KLEOX|nr:hypothetical protein [Klebsiella oxytoca]
MSEPDISELRSKISHLDNQLKHLTVRTDISLSLMSTLISALGGTDINACRDVIIQQISKFEYGNSFIDESIVLEEKRIVQELIGSSALPDI